MNLKVAKDEAEVGSSTFLINEFPANILFDSLANYSFISHKFGRKLTLPVRKLENALLVEVASGKIVPVSDCMRNIIIGLNGNMFHKELLPIDLNGFGIVLGTDWLSVNVADRKCRTKIVKVNPHGT